MQIFFSESLNGIGSDLWPWAYSGVIKINQTIT